MEYQQDIKRLAQLYISIDKNVSNKHKIQKFLDNNDEESLELHLRNPLIFGTAGLRAQMDAGFSFMNDLTVIQATQGLYEYLITNLPESFEMGIVIGHDHRFNSERFAKFVASIFLNGKSDGKKKCPVYFLSPSVATPLVPFAIKHFRAGCGIMITASHNPSADNGYKLYFADSCQILSPHDNLIQKFISANLKPWKWDESFNFESFSSFRKLLVYI
jgi:phosphoglucomutase